MRECRLSSERNDEMMTLEGFYNINPISSMMEAKNVNFARLQSILSSQMTLPSFTSAPAHELISYLRNKLNS
jgi:hypothetical protein